MAKHGDIKWFEEIIIENDVVIERKKVLKQYVKESWFDEGWWMTIPTEKDYFDYKVDNPQTVNCPKNFLGLPCAGTLTCFMYGGNVV